MRCGARAVGLGRDAGGSGTVEPAAGFVGSTRTVLPLSPPVPRHAARQAGAPGRSFKVPCGSSAVTLMAARRISRTRSASGTWARPDVLPHALCERSLVAMTRGHGAWPRPWLARRAGVASAVGRGLRRRRPGERRASPRRPAPRRRRSGAPSQPSLPTANLPPLLSLTPHSLSFFTHLLPHCSSRPSTVKTHAVSIYRRLERRPRPGGHPGR